MIVSSLETAKLYLPSVNTSLVGQDRLQDFFRRAQEWATQNILGEDLESALEGSSSESETYGTLHRMVCRLICELGLRMAVPEMDLQLSESGFVVQNNGQMSPASQQRVDRFINSLEERISWNCDAIVKVLIANSGTDGTYEDWRGTEQFNSLTQAFTPTREPAVTQLRLKNVTQWPQFAYLQPELAQAIRNVASQYVSEAEIDRLLELYRDNETLLVHRRAINHLSWAGLLEVHDEHELAVRAAIQARKIMVANKDSFTAFKDSDVFVLSKVGFGDGPSYNCL